MLIKLLRLPDDGPVQIDGLSASDQQFLAITCAYTIMLYQICFTCGFIAEEAWHGVQALHANAHQMIYKICAAEAELGNAPKH